MAGDYHIFQEEAASSMISSIIGPTLMFEQMEEMERNRAEKVEQAFQEWLESRSF